MSSKTRRNALPVRVPAQLFGGIAALSDHPSSVRGPIPVHARRTEHLRPSELAALGCPSVFRGIVSHVSSLAFVWDWLAHLAGVLGVAWSSPPSGVAAIIAMDVHRVCWHGRSTMARDEHAVDRPSREPTSRYLWTMHGTFRRPSWRYRTRHQAELAPHLRKSAWIAIPAGVSQRASIDATCYRLLVTSIRGAQGRSAESIPNPPTRARQSSDPGARPAPGTLREQVAGCRSKSGRCSRSAAALR